MPTVRRLDRGRRAARGRVGIDTGPTPGNDGDIGTLHQPALDAAGVPIRQQGQHTVAFQLSTEATAGAGASRFHEAVQFSP